MLDNIIKKIFNRKNKYEIKDTSPLDIEILDSDSDLEVILKKLSQIGLINIYKSCDSPYWNVSLESLPQSRIKLCESYENINIKVRGFTIKEALESLNNKVTWITNIGLIDEQ